MKIEGKTVRELAQLAQDVVDGKVFGSWQIPEGQEDLFPMIFTPVLFAEQPENAGHVYEYLDKAAPRCVNGYPIFFSMFYLADSDLKVFADMCKELLKKKEAALADLVADADEQG